jgi:hypothetical protein
MRIKMNPIYEEDKKCPICDKTIRSDATIHEYCKLCGMGIPEPSDVPKMQTNEGTVYFCCDKCYSIFKNKIV